MKILMISIDKGLLGKNQLGDVIERHKKYGEFCERLDVIVFNRSHSEQSQESRKLSNKVTSYPTNSKSKLFYYFNALKIGKKLFQKNNYDLIICQTPFITGLVGLKLKKQFNSKLLIHFHGDFKKYFKSVIKNADAIRVMSSGQKQKLIQKGINKNKIHIISTPINLENFNHPNLEQVNNFKKQSDYPKILHVGRPDKIKDYKTLFSAIEKVSKEKEIHFWQVGGNFTTEKIKKETGINNLSLTGNSAFKLYPKTELNSLINIYNAIDIVVLSSKSESFGKVLVEANACGKPVISTATTGAKEIIQDGYNGFLFPIGDAQKMANKILELLNNPELAKSMGENGKKLVFEKYSDNTKKIINLWKNII